jgi:hypothetical protein
MIALKADQLHDGGGHDESDALVLVWSRDSRKAKGVGAVGRDRASQGDSRRKKSTLRVG